jgi:hypothetical protein
MNATLAAVFAATNDILPPARLLNASELATLTFATASVFVVLLKVKLALPPNVPLSLN